MLDWKVKTGDEKLRQDIQETKESFDEWFKFCWAHHFTKEQMLSEDSPLPHIYYKMTKSVEEIKEKFPHLAQERCDDCGEYVDKWVETEFSFCDEHDCGLKLCKNCANKLKRLIEKL